MPTKQKAQNSSLNSPENSGIFTGPVSQTMWEESIRTMGNSRYPDNFDYRVYDKLARRFENNPVRGGFVFKGNMKFIEAEDCSSCFHRFELDTYGRGCLHNCAYCYAKSYLHVRKYWNEPVPFPIDIVNIRKAFYTVFETDKRSKYRDVLERKIPLRIGSMSDSFMWLDKQFRVTHELMKILSFYNYPSLIFTRSDLVAEDEYIEVMRPELTQVQFSMSSTNEKLTRQIEPGAPSPARRLAALKKLKENGFKTLVRINPLIPHFPDGYYSNPEFDRASAKEFPYFSWDMVDAIAEAKVDTLLAGVVRLYRPNLNFMKKALGYDIREIFAKDAQWERASLHFSEQEVSYYYRELARLSRAKGLRFSTCYIGNDASGESFERYQDLWANKSDCCDAKGMVEGINATCADAPKKPAKASPGATGCQAVGSMLENLNAARLAALAAKGKHGATPQNSIGG